MKKILIVDDLQPNLYLLDVLLKTNGYEVDMATNGIGALEAARKSPPDLIISDILMPGMDGFSLCRAWKSDERLRNIPFVFYTATYTDPKDEKLALGLGATRFVVKPVEPDVFLALVKELVATIESSPPVEKLVQEKKEDEFLKEYNEALIRKLEDKMLQLQRSHKRLASLYQASGDLHSMKPSIDLIQSILRTLVETAGYQQANYFSYNDKTDTLTFSAGVGFPEEVLILIKDRFVMKLGEERGILGKVALTGKTYNVADVSCEPNWIPLDTKIQSALFTPVHYEDELMGVIGLFCEEKNAFFEEDERDIASLANNLAIAIENTRNQENVKKQLARVSALHNIDLAISNVLDLRLILNIIFDQVTDQLKVDAVDVLLSQSRAPIYEYSAGRGFFSPEYDRRRIRMNGSLARKVIETQRLVCVTGIADQEVSPEFTSLWMREGFYTYLGAPLIAKGELLGILEVFVRTPFFPNSEWSGYFETLAGQAAIAIDNARLFNDLQRSNVELRIAYDETINGWSRAMDLRDEETEGHTQRVTEITVRLAKLMDVSEEQIVHMRRGALLHDIGKLGVPDSILLKPGKLTPKEMAIMRRHPEFAYDMLLPIHYLYPALDIPYCHHERWDGTGYPRGLKAEEIPLAARIFAIVDVWDALCSDRPYRKAWTEEQALEYIRTQIGKHFDPRVAEKFLSLLAEGGLAIKK